MPTVEERLASLEAKVDTMSDLRNLIGEFRGDVNGRFGDVNGRFGDVNRQFGDVNRQFTELREDMNRRFIEMRGDAKALDQKVDRQFIWLMGMMVTGFITVIGALVGIVYG